MILKLLKGLMMWRHCGTVLGIIYKLIPDKKYVLLTVISNCL